MKIEQLLDIYGDDIFAFALIATKDFSSAKEVFVRLTSAYYEIPEHDGVFDEIIKRAYALCQEVDSNEGASTLTGVDLDAKRLAVLEELLVKRESVRIAAHLYYETDLEAGEIALLMGKSEKYVAGLLSDELSDELKAKLDKYYKEICVKITASDKLKAYVMHSVYDSSKRDFEVREEAVAKHVWSTEQKIIVIVIAIIITFAISFIIPIAEKYFDMLEDESGYSYEVPETDEIFRYTYEADEVQSE